MSKEIKISKKKFYAITAGVVIVLLLFAYFLNSHYSEKGQLFDFGSKLLPEQKAQQHTPEEIQEYKKAIYESLLCRYSCPLDETTFEGQQILFPNQKCITDCVNTLKDKGYSPGQFTEEELLSDNLIGTIDSIVTVCRDTNSLQDGVSVDNSKKFFECARPVLEGLKEDFEYLN